MWWLAFLDMGEHAVMETWIKESEAEFVPGPETVQGGEEEEEERDRASDRGASEPAEASASDPMVTDDYRGATEPTLQPAGADLTADRVRVESWRRQSSQFGNRATENGVEGRWRERWWLSSLTLGEPAVKEERLMVGEAVFVPDQ